MRRRTLLVVLAGLAVVVAVGVAMVWPREDRITAENFGRIDEGMSTAEVEAILGPPGDYRTLPPRLDDPWSHSALHPPANARIWHGNAGSIYVSFNHSTSAGLAWTSANAIDRGTLGNLLWRAKRQWRRWFP